VNQRLATMAGVGNTQVVGTVSAEQQPDAVEVTVQLENVLTHAVDGGKLRSLGRKLGMLFPSGKAVLTALGTARKDQSAAMDDDCALVVAQLLAQNTKWDIQRLRMDTGSISPRGVFFLTRAMSVRPRVRQLVLSNNPVGIQGARFIAEHVAAHDCVLTELRLFACRVGTEGARVLGEALHANRSVRVLDLTNNDVRDEGAVAMAHMLRANQALRELRLLNNGVRREGSEALAEALAANSTLELLFVAVGNNVPAGVFSDHRAVGTL